MSITLLLTVLLVCFLATQGFSPVGRSGVNSYLTKMNFDFDKAVTTLSKNKILTKTAQLGLLTRLEKAGFTVSSAAPLLKIAEEQDLLGVLEASSDKVLPLVAKAIDLSPSLLPLAGTALKAPPSALFGGAAASLAAAGLVVTFIPDNSVSDIALQTALAFPLGVLLPGALGVGGVVLSKLGNK